MYNIKTNVPALDNDNINLFKASEILEQIGNEPNPTANEFYAQLAVSNFPTKEHSDIILAAISIETMMAMDIAEDGLFEPTVH